MACHDFGIDALAGQDLGDPHMGLLTFRGVQVLHHDFANAIVWHVERRLCSSRNSRPLQACQALSTEDIRSATGRGDVQSDDTASEIP